MHVRFVFALLSTKLCNGFGWAVDCYSAEFESGRDTSMFSCISNVPHFQQSSGIKRWCGFLTALFHQKSLFRTGWVTDCPSRWRSTLILTKLCRASWHVEFTVRRNVQVYLLLFLMNDLFIGCTENQRHGINGYSSATDQLELGFTTHWDVDVWDARR